MSAPIFDEQLTKELVKNWQHIKSDLILEQIFKQTDRLLRALIFARGIYQYMELQEIISMIQTKIWRGLHLFDPERGTLHNFLTRVIHNRISQAQIDTSKNTRHASMDDEDCLDVPHDNDENCFGMEDLVWRIYQVRTTCTDEMELEAQRWLVKSFVDSSFTIRRHHAANAMSTVYGIDRVRSRQLHDYTLLEVRRAILDGVVPPDVDPEKLKGTRQKALRKYYDLMTPEDFSKLCFLMKNISSSVVGNVWDVLDGFPDSKPLFITPEG